MSEENSNQPVDINDDNQADFENDFYDLEQEDEVEDQDFEEQEEDVEDFGEDEDAPANDEDDEPSGKKVNPTQKRINDLTAKFRQEEREKLALLRRLEELENVVKKETKEEQVPLRQQLPDGAPDPDAKNEKGDPLYPLGEFDPQYIKALTKWSVDTEFKAAEEARAKAAEEAAIKQEQAKIGEEWLERVEKASEEVPDIKDRIIAVTDALEGLDPKYGDYLATIVMQSEVGPELMHYFSDNIGEAQKIVASGALAATLAIGRLEAQFLNSASRGEQKRNKKLSEAKEPPSDHARGVNGRFSVAPDTDNQAAFEKVFFQKP
jgi:hypothetical protein